MIKRIKAKTVLGILFSVMLFITAINISTQADHLDEEGWAMICAPGNVGEDIETEIQALRIYLINNGWTDEHIILLIDNKNWDYCDGDATKANIQNGIEYIAEHSTSTDIVFLGILDRASKGQDGTTYFETSNGDFTDMEFGEWIDGITYEEMVIEVSSNYAGGFIDECKGDYRLIVCSHTENQITEINYYTLSRGLTTQEADTDEDGRISVEEAHAYEKDLVELLSNGEQTPTSWDHAEREMFL